MSIHPLGIMDEHLLRRPGWRAHRWVEMQDGSEWALPPLTSTDLLIHPGIVEAQDKARDAYEANPEPEGESGSVDGIMDRWSITAEYANSVASILLPMNYHLTPDQARLLLPWNTFGPDFMAILDAVNAIVEEVQEGIGNMPIGWDSHDGILFDN